ncbi:hypothetical protein PF005_g6775 [Phytophthora fragariae]|uniref:Uncharacterized protein n=1 Tax=Phytophthora fragariae TaxID=53985 RepID=A0A6A3UG62_9STRA|nr:hypothetical protein PF003_g3235 [Phytophthora fragariae]KAE8944460.1 hypothetical protein PF009_g5873 [Phytophthora fragariae]KAE9021719.1 hypothetical protein PF011_g4819 [Phytophthora fragariae]KAE9123621.1 hypothetical protein PF007_g6993 [Phytophthora fragariae]KAE9124498.1 hypothetical protein PF010_g5989 [Phytophthora fragariae]
MLRTSSRFVRRCSSARLPPARRNFSSGYGDWVDTIDEEYLSMRGLAIASRVFRGVPEFKGYIRGKPRVFVSGASDEARISMYVMSKFPMSTRVDLPEFVRGAERAASTVLHRLYAQDQSETKEFLEHLATSDSLKALLHKPSASTEGEGKQGRAVLEQLNVNVAALEAVEYTWERVEEDVKAEWLTLRVQYDVTEHLLISPEGGEGIEDRRAINTRFAWTFEADVTNPDGLEWGLVDATPFEEKSAVLTTNAAQTEEKE